MKVAGPTVPISYKFKALKLPFLAPLQILRDLKELDKIIADAAGGDENARQALQQLAGEELNKQIREAEEKAEAYCKNANKCAGS